MITNKKSGIWTTDDVHKKLNADRWVTYDTTNDPTILEVFGFNSVNGDSGLNAPSQPISSPVQIPGTCWKKINFGACTSSAIRCDNTLWTWGNNANGQLGHNDLVHRSSPTQIPGTNWCYMAVGKEDLQNTSYAIKTDNTLWGWGSNLSGELGINDITVPCYSSPVQIPGASWCKVIAGIDNHLALRTDNTLWSWGSGVNGSHGLNCTTAASSPTQLPGNWISIATHVCGGFGVKDDNTLWAWGNNANGQLGLLDRVHRSSPTQIPGTTWCAISATERSIAAIKTDNTLWVWGLNSCGQLGINNKSSRSSPVQLPGTTWCKVQMGFERMLAEKTDKTLWMTGNNIPIANTLDFRSSPVQLPGTCWIDFSIGTCTTGILKY